jgi:hypothetical protein
MTGGYVSGLFQHAGKFALWDRIFFHYFFQWARIRIFLAGGQFMPQSLFPDWDIKIPLCELSAFAVKSIFS